MLALLGLASYWGWPAAAPARAGMPYARARMRTCTAHELRFQSRLRVPAYRHVGSRRTFHLKYFLLNTINSGTVNAS